MKKKTVLERFKEIEDLEVADEQGKTVVDILPYKCEKVWKSLKALEIIKEKDVNIGLVKVLGSVEQYNQTYVYDNMLNVKWCLTQEEFELLRSVIE